MVNGTGLPGNDSTTRNTRTSRRNAPSWTAKASAHGITVPFVYLLLSAAGQFLPLGYNVHETSTISLSQPQRHFPAFAIGNRSEQRLVCAISMV